MSDLRTPRATLLGSSPSQVILTLQIGGKTVRLTDGETITLSKRDGSDTYVYNPGLSTVSDLSRALGWFAGDLSVRSVSCQVMVPSLDVAAIVAGGRGHGWTGEIATVYPGQAWEERRVVVQGRVTDPLYGEPGEVFGFAVVEDPGDDAGLIPNESLRVGFDTWPRDDATRGTPYTGVTLECDPNIEGACYPLVIGCPGYGIPYRVAGSTFVSYTPAVPMLYVERTESTTDIYDHTYLVAGHPCTATQIRAFNFTDTIYETIPLDAGVDMLGQAVRTTTPGGSGAIPVDIGVENYAAFDPDWGGGLPDPYGPGPLRRADHVIRWALSQSTIRVDSAMMPRLSGLSSYLVDTYLNTPTSPWEWLRSTILPYLPASVVSGPGGVYIAPWNYSATTRDAVAHLEQGRNADRITPVSHTSTSEVVNRITVEFAPSAANGVYTQARTITGALRPAEENSTTGAFLSSLWCRRSQTVYGTRAVSYQIPWIYDSATADLVCAWMARAKSFPRRQVGYRLPQTLDWLRPGDVVTLTDSGLSLTNQVVHVEALVPEAGGVTASLTWWEPLAYPSA